MLNFILGYICGTLTSLVILLVMTFFRASIEKRIKVIETSITNAGPRPQGVIIMPEDENEEVRREFVRKRAARGQRTTLSDLKDIE